MGIVQVQKDDARKLKDIADILASAKRIIVVTGAGISTSCGIPDFRSENGLYRLTQTQQNEEDLHKNQVVKDRIQLRQMPNLPIVSPRSSRPPRLNGKDLFDATVLSSPISNAAFLQFISSLRKKVREEVRQTTRTHRFIRSLRDCQKLVRCYTQNIDGLEGHVGLCTDLDRGKGSRARFSKKSLKLPCTPCHALPGRDHDGGCEVVQLHGNLELLRCNFCCKTCAWEDGEREALLFKGDNPVCPSCKLSDQERRDRGKRGVKVGSLRPNIILYGEQHPFADAIGAITENDLAILPDTLLILGTSLRVHGLKVLVREFAKSVHARAKGKGKVIFVNFTQPPQSIWKDVIDYWVSMDCDTWVDSMRQHRPDLCKTQAKLEVSVTKSVSAQKNRYKAACQSVHEEGEENISNAAKQTQRPSISKTKSRKPFQEVFNEAPGSLLTPKIASKVMVDQGRLDSKVSSCAQLPTPPSTSKRLRYTDVSKKRAWNDEIEIPNTPSKRTRAAPRIWIDELSYLNRGSTDEKAQNPDQASYKY